MFFHKETVYFFVYSANLQIMTFFIKRLSEVKIFTSVLGKSMFGTSKCVL